MLNVFNRKSAAKVLGISTETIDRYRKNGKLSYRQIGDRIVFTESDLIDFLNACAAPLNVVSAIREKPEMTKVDGGKK